MRNEEEKYEEPESKKRAKNALQGRQQNYARTFDPLSIPAQEVLRDLSDFCRANESTYSVDPRDHAILEGRRQVWLRIQEHLNLTIQELWEMRTKTRY